MRLWLSVIAYNLGNLWRRLVLPQDWQLVADQLAADRADFNDQGGRRGKIVGGKGRRRASFGGKTDAFCGLWNHLVLQTRLTSAFSMGQVYVIGRTGTRYWKFRNT